MSRIYIASSWRNGFQQQLVQELRKRGHKVYDFRHPYGRNDAPVWESVSITQNLLMIICRYNLCSVIVCPRTKQMNIVGLDANVIIVKEFYEYLLQVFRRLSMERLNEAQNEYLGTGRFMTEPKKKDFLRSYLEGVSRGLQENYEAQQPTSQETGLMVCHKELIKDYLASKSIGKARRSSVTKVRPDGFNAGFDDGKNVNLSKQLNTSCRAAGQLK